MAELNDESAGFANWPFGFGTPRTASRRRLLGDLLVTEGLITKAQLQDALRAQAELPAHVPLGQILVDQEALTQEQLRQILDKYNKKYRLGDLLVETMTITEEQLEVALRHQRETGLRLGDVLVKLQLVTEQQVKQALCTQLRVTFIDLDNVTIDRELAQLVSKPYAQRHRVIPIAQLEDRITVAMDDPTDAEVLRELEASTGSRIDVVTSTSAGFERAFARAYGEPLETVTVLPARPSPEATLTGSPAREVPAESREEPGIDPGEHQATIGAFHALEERHAEALRALAELQAAHQALQQERKATAETFRALATRTLAELDATREALEKEREGNGRIVRTLEERHARTAAELAELQAAHRALLTGKELSPDARGNGRDREDGNPALEGDVQTLESILRRLQG